MRQPGTLFRYRSLAGDGFRFVQDIFFRNRLYWPLHSQLNDPAEGLYRIERPLAKRSDGKWRPQPAALLQPGEGVRVLSFTDDPAHPLMWAHYADAHRGICLGFRRDALGAVARVRYPQRVPRLGSDLSAERRRDIAFLTKRAPWAYEREWRLVDTEGQDNPMNYLTLGRAAIRQVIFGDRTSEDDRNWVLLWLKLAGCRVKLRQVNFAGASGRLHLFPVDSDGRIGKLPYPIDLLE